MLEDTYSVKTNGIRVVIIARHEKQANCDKTSPVFSNELCVVKLNLYFQVNLYFEVNLYFHVNQQVHFDIKCMCIMFHLERIWWIDAHKSDCIDK